MGSWLLGESRDPWSKAISSDWNVRSYQGNVNVRCILMNYCPSVRFTGPLTGSWKPSHCRAIIRLLQTNLLFRNNSKMLDYLPTYDGCN